MVQKLLRTSSKLIPEQTEVSIRTLKDSITILATTSITTIDCNNIDYVRVNLQADTQIIFTNANREGQQIVLAVYQYDTIPHTVSFDMSNIRLGFDIWSIPQLSNTIGKLDRIIFMYDATNQKYDLMGYSRGY